MKTRTDWNNKSLHSTKMRIATSFRRDLGKRAAHDAVTASAVANSLIREGLEGRGLWPKATKGADYVVKFETPAEGDDKVFLRHEFGESSPMRIKNVYLPILQAIAEKNGVSASAVANALIREGLNGK